MLRCLASLFACLALLAPIKALAWSFTFDPSSEPSTWTELSFALPAQLLIPSELGTPTSSPDVTIIPHDPPTVLVYASQPYTVFDVSAVPEPATALLLCLGLAGLALAPRRGWSFTRSWRRS